MQKFMGFCLGLMLTLAVALVPAQDGESDDPGTQPKKKGFAGKEPKENGPNGSPCKKKVSWTVNSQTDTSLAATYETECGLGDVIVWMTPSLRSR